MNARLKNVRITPRKIGLAAKLVRKKQALKADSILNFCIKKSANILRKLLLSAIANAKQKGKNVENLYIKDIFVGPGATLKRSMPRARGNSSRILKRTSNILINLEEKIKDIKDLDISDIEANDIKDYNNEIEEEDING